MRPTQQQLDHFYTFGYIVFRALFSAGEMAWISREFEQVVDGKGGGRAHDGSRRTLIVPTIDHSQRLCTLLDDERIVGIAGAILGDDFNYASGDGNYYSGDTGWHPDGNYPDLFAIKMAFYLDSLTATTGCLRVLPGSHKAGSLWRAGDISPGQAEELWGLTPDQVPGQTFLETAPGDLAIFDHNTFHASFGGGQRRRMFTMNLTRRGHTADDIERVDQYLRDHCPVAHGFKIGGMYTEIMGDTASSQRLVHLEQMHQRHALVHPEDTLPRALGSQG
ncbi:MAG: hypothetical protein GKR89_04475 [Candidatus Latescibacteria bacterium]|nr:hypothetical protein [Candidatus Latescibacterota bacterium]